MAKLKTQYDSEEAIPEAHRDLFTESGGKWNLTEVAGIQTQANIDRLESALENEKTAHKETKGKLKAWGDRDVEETLAQLDRIPELEAAAKGKLDESQIEEMVDRRVAAKINQETGPLTRKIETLMTENEELKGTVGTLQTDITGRELRDAVQPLAIKKQVIPEHLEDVLMYADKHFDRTDDGSFITKDGVGVTPGIDPAAWLDEMTEKRPGWLPPSVGGGSRGSGGGGGGGTNPFARKTWNVTEQGRLVRESPEKAEKLAAAAGTKVGGMKPSE